MRIETSAIVLSLRAHGEHGAIVRALTPEDGVQAGYVRGGRSRRLRPILVPGNRAEERKVRYALAAQVRLMAAQRVNDQALVHPPKVSRSRLLANPTRKIPQRRHLHV